MTTEPFWARISYYVEKRKTAKLPTMAVSYQNRKFLLFWNEDFVMKIYESNPQDYLKNIMGVLKHEFMHIIFDHIPVMLEDKDNSQLLNVAMDLAINSFIEADLPAGEGISPCVAGKGRFKDLPPFKSFGWYMQAMMNDPQYDDIGSSFDIHLSGEELEELMGGDGKTGNKIIDGMNEVERGALKDKIVRAAAEESMRTNTWGSVSESLQEEVAARLNKSVDWKSILQRFVRYSISSTSTSSFKRINRRYPWMHPGRRKEYETKVAVSIDMSGSMSNEVLAEVAGQLNVLSEIVEFTVIPFDTVVAEDHIYLWEKGQKFKTIERPVCGGTDLQPAIDYVDKSSQQFSAHLIFSDLYAEVPSRPRVESIFFVPEGGNREFDHPTKRVYI
jgi:predicted metal-dependent peptidase